MADKNSWRLEKNVAEVASRRVARGRGVKGFANVRRLLRPSRRRRRSAAPRLADAGRGAPPRGTCLLRQARTVRNLFEQSYTRALDRIDRERKTLQRRKAAAAAADSPATSSCRPSRARSP